jgi:hypothetical protein
MCPSGADPWCQFRGYWWRKPEECPEKATELPQVNDRLYHIMLYRVQLTPIDIYQSLEITTQKMYMQVVYYLNITKRFNTTLSELSLKLEYILDGRKDGRKEGRTDGQTDRGKTVYPPPPSGSGCITKIGWLGIRIMLPSGATCLSADCCVSNLNNIYIYTF